jgi:hypothetical protein
MRPKTVDPRIGTLIEQLIVPALLERLLAERQPAPAGAPTVTTARVESGPNV